MNTPGASDHAAAPQAAGQVLIAAALSLAAGIVLGIGFDENTPGRAAAIIPILFEALPVIALLWGAAIGYGWVLRRWLAPHCRDRLTISAGLGMAGLLLIHWLVATTLTLNATSTAVICGIGVAIAAASAALAWRRGDPLTPATPIARPWTLALAGAPLGLLIVAACCPPGTLWRVEAFGYDAMTYHLQLPRQWLDAGRITADTHNVYSFLPSLIESGYAMIGTLRGSMVDAIYTCQLFHVSLAVYAAVALGRVVAGFVGPLAGAAAGALLLAVPWTLITGASAYNELAVIAFGAAALLLLTDISSERIGGAAAVGVLVGAATLSKLTAGPMIAVPIGLMLLLRLNPALRWRKPPALATGMRSLAIATVAGVITLSPYLIRNAVWTGNPVFPFATRVLGTGHWDAQQAARWDAAHGIDAQADRGVAPLVAAARQWLFNTGYGAIGGKAVSPDTTDIARFGQEGGFPALWVGVILLGFAAIRPGVTRRIATVMLVMIVAQAAFWLFGTHRQSRFLLPMLLPASVLVGLGLGRLGEHTPRLRFARPITAAALPLVMFTISLSVLYSQVRSIPASDGPRIDPPPPTPTTPPPGFWVDSLDAVTRHPINGLPPGSRVLLIADNGSLLYLRPAVDYATPFDTSPLGDAARQANGDADAVIAALREAGYSHLWVGWSEYDRLRETHGYDPAVTPELLDTMGRKLPTITDAGHASLHALPRADR